MIFDVLFGRGHLCHLKVVDAVFLSPLTKATIGNQLNQGMWWGLLSGKKNEHNYLQKFWFTYYTYFKWTKNAEKKVPANAIFGL